MSEKNIKSVKSKEILKNIFLNLEKEIDVDIKEILEDLNHVNKKNE